MPGNQHADLPSRLAFQKIGDSARQMPAVSVDDQLRCGPTFSERDGSAGCRLVQDQVRSAAHRDLDAGAHLRALRNLRKPLFEPSLMAVKKVLDFALRD